MILLESLIDEIKSLKEAQEFPALLVLINRRLGYEYSGFAIHYPLGLQAAQAAQRPFVMIAGPAPTPIHGWLNDEPSVRKFCSGQLTPAPLSELASDEGPSSERMNVIVVPLLGRRREFGCILLGLEARSTPAGFAEKVGWYWMILAGYLYEAYLRCAANAKSVIALTSRERECLTLAAQGKTSWEIGRILGVSERTINFHVNNCMRKTGCSKRQQAVSTYLQSGAMDI